MGVVATLVVGAAIASANTDDVTADCVAVADRDADGYLVVDDDRCEEGYRGPHGAYIWYFGGALRASRVFGGTTVRPSNANISTRSGAVIQRGGFGGRGGSGGS
ncbi:hypothetical protein [Sphaerisporangium sp. TRM90804]|uniref:hypothetical protein n=1 Tax=Sphaerisporangium sp. TRM90804 TaxID=3031113 RepID=UPI0024495483|nr:hypothetical protein [Sphaerisporangium sp. TRM90804]MDH2428276.1 hypothetical protein [Sphaerisporangium sp. TRM90804]